MTNFGDRDPGSRRPTPTIEGTATEIVEPSAEPATESASQTSEQPGSDGEKATAKPKRVPPRTSPVELKSFLTHLAAGLLGGLVGVLALSFYRGQPAEIAVPDLSAVESRLSKLESEPAPGSDNGL